MAPPPEGRGGPWHGYGEDPLRPTITNAEYRKEASAIGRGSGYGRTSGLFRVRCPPVIYPPTEMPKSNSLSTNLKRIYRRRARRMIDTVQWFQRSCATTIRSASPSWRTASMSGPDHYTVFVCGRKEKPLTVLFTQLDQCRRAIRGNSIGKKRKKNWCGLSNAGWPKRPGQSYITSATRTAGSLSQRVPLIGKQRLQRPQIAQGRRWPRQVDTSLSSTGRGFGTARVKFCARGRGGRPRRIVAAGLAFAQKQWWGGVLKVYLSTAGA